jgi:hypothetical protein
MSSVLAQLSKRLPPCNASASSGLQWVAAFCVINRLLSRQSYPQQSEGLECLISVGKQSGSDRSEDRSEY